MDRVLAPLEAINDIFDITSKRVVKVMDEGYKLKNLHDENYLSITPSPFFAKTYTREVEKMTSFKSYKVVSRTNTGIGGVSYYCGENSKKMTSLSIQNRATVSSVLLCCNLLLYMFRWYETSQVNDWK